MASNAAELYDEDFYAWTQQQAKALRTHFKGDNRIDALHLAEEVEDLGKSELHAVESYIENVIEHLLKLDYSGSIEARDHWRAEVDAFSASIERKSTPRIRQQVETELAFSMTAPDAGRPDRRIGASPTSYGGCRSTALTTGTRFGIATFSPKPVSISPVARRGRERDVARGTPDGAARV